MTFTAYILPTITRMSLFIAYIMGLVLSGGIHPHESLRHEHEQAGSHTHTLVVHTHERMVIPSTDFREERLAPIGDGHQHTLPLIQMVAVPVSTSNVSPSAQHNTVSFAETDAGDSSHLSISFLFIVPHETSPPLLSLRYVSDSGRSPPAA